MRGKEFFWAGTIFKQDMNPAFLHSWKMGMPAIPAIQIHSLVSGEPITILTAITIAAQINGNQGK